MNTPTLKELTRLLVMHTLIVTRDREITFDRLNMYVQLNKFHGYYLRTETIHRQNQNSFTKIRSTMRDVAEKIDAGTRVSCKERSIHC